MVALTSQEQAASAVVVTLDPQPAGQWRWLGTRTLLFEPKGQFPKATVYRMTVPAGTVSANGDALADGFSATFSTPPVQVEQHWPDGGVSGRQPVILLVFDQQIDPYAMLAQLRIRAGRAEVAVVAAGQARIENLAGRVVYGPVSLPSSSGGGPPTIGDFDGDGLPELAAAGSDSYTIFDPDCVDVPDLVRCNSGRTDGILWTQPSQDHSSNITGSSIFDFEGDGRAEAIYADEAFVRVYSGLTGEVVFSQWRSSCTWNENPIVADVDGDFNAELVVPSNESCGTSPSTLGGLGYDSDAAGRILDPLFSGTRCEENDDCLSGLCDAGLCRCTVDRDCGDELDGFVCAAPPAGTPGEGGLTCRAAWLGSVRGIRVYSDVLDRWASSRTIWNQHAYSVTSIREDGTLPRTSEWVPNWTEPGLNNFRQNVQGEVQPDTIADLTARRTGEVICTDDGAAYLRVQVCNRGTAPLGTGIPVTFFVGDPSACMVIPDCTWETEEILRPGTCTLVTCVWRDLMEMPTDVTVVANDDGSCPSAFGERECHEGNNTTVIPRVFCGGPG